MSDPSLSTVLTHLVEHLEAGDTDAVLPLIEDAQDALLHATHTEPFPVRDITASERLAERAFILLEEEHERGVDVFGPMSQLLLTWFLVRASMDHDDDDLCVLERLNTLIERFFAGGAPAASLDALESLVTMAMDMNWDEDAFLLGEVIDERVHRDTQLPNPRRFALLVTTAEAYLAVGDRDRDALELVHEALALYGIADATKPVHDDTVQDYLTRVQALLETATTRAQKH
ncbi:MAG: hypothetical protein AAGI01_06935 [Myxococcota bacterium]